MPLKKQQINLAEQSNMNNARRSLFFFGLYMIFGVGVGFIFMPMFILNTFGLSAGDDVWIRFVGLLGSIIGGYYLLIVRAKFDQFIPWTVAMRLYGAGFIVVIVFLGKLGPSMLLFGAIDAAGAVWTWLALRSSSK